MTTYSTVDAAHAAITSVPSPAVANRPRVTLTDKGTFLLTPSEAHGGPAMELTGRDMDELMHRLEREELVLFRRAYIVTHEDTPFFSAQVRVFTDGRKAMAWFNERAPKTMFSGLTGGNPPGLGKLTVAQAETKSTILCTLLDADTP